MLQTIFAIILKLEWYDNVSSAEMCKTVVNVIVRNLGRMSFQRSLEFQKYASRAILDKLSSGDISTLPNTLFLVEHDPVYTIGIRRKTYSEEEEMRLKALGVDFAKTDRGGLITFHGPGQLVAYPVLYLGNFTRSKSMKWYINQLEKTVISMCEELGIVAETSPYTGVWVADKKLTAIGVHGSRHVTTHGLAINCNVDLDWFKHIVPCGISDKGVTSLTELLGHNMTVKEVIPIFLSAFEKIFQCNLIHNEYINL